MVRGGQIRSEEQIGASPGAAELTRPRFRSTALPLPKPGSLTGTMVAKSRKQTGKSPATHTDRDRSPLVSPHSRSSARRPPREGRASAGSHSNGLLGVRHKLGLASSGAVGLGVTLLLGEFGALAC